jgi:hypothetical protein
MNRGGPSRGSDLLDGSFISDICSRRCAIRNVYKGGSQNKNAGKAVHTPKGRRFQAIFGLVCSWDAEARGNTRSSMFKGRRARGFRKESVENVRGMRRLGGIRG